MVYPWEEWNQQLYEDNGALFNSKSHINIQKIRSCKDLTDLFTKFLRDENFGAISLQDWILLSQ